MSYDERVKARIPEARLSRVSRTTKMINFRADAPTLRALKELVAAAPPALKTGAQSFVIRESLQETAARRRRSR